MFNLPAKASPVQIPSRATSLNHIRPMRNSVEGLNQEIEKLVLSSGSPAVEQQSIEGECHLSRSVLTQTPIRDFDTSQVFSHCSSDESSDAQSPEESPVVRVVAGTTTESGSQASPRINKFLAQKPPEGCERVRLKEKRCDEPLSRHTVVKPTFATGFQLRPSMGSAFQKWGPTTCGAAVDGRTEGQLVSDDNAVVTVIDSMANPVDAAGGDRLAADDPPQSPE